MCSGNLSRATHKELELTHLSTRCEEEVREKQEQYKWLETQDG